MWHDNSGSSPSWFLSRILVKDLATEKRAVFVADKWFAVEEDDGKVEREILAVDAPLSSKVVFTTKGELRWFGSQVSRSISLCVKECVA